MVASGARAQSSACSRRTVAALVAGAWRGPGRVWRGPGGAGGPRASRGHPGPPVSPPPRRSSAPPPPARTRLPSARWRRARRRGLEVTVLYPDAARRFPLVLFGHGLGGLPSDYARRCCAAGRPPGSWSPPRRTRRPAGTPSTAPARRGRPARGRVVRARPGAGARQAWRRPAAWPDSGRPGGRGRSLRRGHTRRSACSPRRDDRLDAGMVLAGSCARQWAARSRGPAAPQLFVHGERDTSSRTPPARPRTTPFPGRRRCSACPRATPAARRGHLVGRGRRHDRRVPAVDALRRPGREGPHPARRRPGWCRGAGQPPLTRYT